MLCVLFIIMIILYEKVSFVERFFSVFYTDYVYTERRMVFAVLFVVRRFDKEHDDEMKFTKQLSSFLLFLLL